MQFIFTAHGVWKRAAAVRARCQQTTSFTLWTFGFFIWTDDIRKLCGPTQGWCLSWHQDRPALLLANLMCNVTSVVFRTAMVVIATANSFWERTTVPISSVQLATRTIIGTLWHFIRANNILVLQPSGWPVLNNLNGFAIFDASSTWNITSISFRTAMQSITATNCIWKRTATPFVWRKSATSHTLRTLMATTTNNIFHHVLFDTVGPPTSPWQYFLGNYLENLLQKSTWALGYCFRGYHGYSCNTFGFTWTGQATCRALVPAWAAVLGIRTGNSFW